MEIKIILAKDTERQWRVYGLGTYINGTDGFLKMCLFKTIITETLTSEN